MWLCFISNRWESVAHCMFGGLRVFRFPPYQAGQDFTVYVLEGPRDSVSSLSGGSGFHYFCIGGFARLGFLILISIRFSQFMYWRVRPTQPPPY